MQLCFTYYSKRGNKPIFLLHWEFKTIFVFDPVRTLDVNTNWRKPRGQRVTLAENELETNQNTRVESWK